MAVLVCGIEADDGVSEGVSSQAQGTFQVNDADRHSVDLPKPQIQSIRKVFLDKQEHRPCTLNITQPPRYSRNSHILIAVSLRPDHNRDITLSALGHGQRDQELSNTTAQYGVQSRIPDDIRTQPRDPANIYRWQRISQSRWTNTCVMLRRRSAPYQPQHGSASGAHRRRECAWPVSSQRGLTVDKVIRMAKSSRLLHSHRMPHT